MPEVSLRKIPSGLVSRSLALLGVLTASLLLAACESAPQQTAGDTALPSAAASAPGAASRALRAGRISIQQWPQLTIDNKQFRAAPGARIVNSSNLMMTPNMVPAGARVEYELDGMGQVRLLRVLDPGADSAPAPRPATPAARSN
jgi:hypothetical protein